MTGFQRSQAQPEPKQVIVVRKDLNMRKGKIAAQVAHAAMLFLVKDAQVVKIVTAEDNKPWRLSRGITDVQRAWLQGLFTKVVVSVNSEAELQDVIAKGRQGGLVVHAVYDSGLTEFHGVTTLTCAAFGPDLPTALEAVTGGLPLL
jgi:PTH2 family peptidyl-tRNA hydrolase